MRTVKSRVVLVAAIGAAMSFSSPALAYVGPGAGLSAIGTLVAVVGAVLLAIVGFVWYPVKRLLRASGKSASPEIEQTPATPAEE